MLCERIPRRATSSGTAVLILVLMKDALRVCKELRRRINGYVLILVLMEDALRVYYQVTPNSLNQVS